MILTTLMAHPRKLIRHAVVALLVAANTAAGSRVYGTRIEPHKKASLPALSVYTLSDSVDEDIASQTEDTHTLELEIAGWVAHTNATPADDAMDDLAEQVEAAMAEDFYLGGLAGEARLVGTVMEVVEDDGRSSPQIGIVVMTYAVTYRVDLVDGEAADDFLSVENTIAVTGGVEDTVPAVDEFIVQEISP